MALWKPDEAGAEISFLELYRGLLIIIAMGDAYEAHEITSLFVEVIEASKGSRWVISLTLASAIEAMVKRLSERKRNLTDDERRAIQEMEIFVKSWSAPDDLKERIRGSLRSLPDISVLRALKSLGIGDAASIETWRKMRNSVTHGELVSPYSSEEQDSSLLALARLFHGLTKEEIRRAMNKPV
jgi:hypothetical protein